MPSTLPLAPPQLAALLLALLALPFAPRILRPARSDSLFLALAAFAAAALSAAYIPLYLRGGPRIIDATSYFLEARALASGYLAFPLDEPVASTLGRFLVRADGPDGPTAAVIFPPGYPALLALGLLARAPLAVGPILAAGITVATFALAKVALPNDAPLADRLSLPRLAALFSVGCAALRYHTADTMSHGLAALLFTGALALALSAARSLETGERFHFTSLGAGLLAGWLLATRPFSALALALTLAFLFLFACSSRSRAKDKLGALALLALGALPGVALLAAHQHAATGELFASSQRAYYAVSDGPPGCFRYGFGEGIGCLGEHGDFVRHNLAHGFGAVAAAGTTLRRLKQHLLDAGNAEPFTLLVLAGAFLAAKRPRAWPLPLAVALQIAAYVPFYFDGNYPGGGARFYADVLPIEHVLAALAALHVAARWQAHAPRVVAVIVALVPLGFALRAGFEHASLRDRDGGAPMFEPERVAHLPRGALVFVDTDHGFNLAFEPRYGLRSNQLRVARFRGDALDRFAWEASGEPPAFRYLFPIPPHGSPREEPRVVPISFDHPSNLGIEGESLWPPLAQQGGFALPAWGSGTCASAGRFLSVIQGDPRAPASIMLSLPAPFLAGRRVAPRLALAGPVAPRVTLAVDGVEHALEVPRDLSSMSTEPRCVTLSPRTIPRSAARVTLTLTHDPSPEEAASTRGSLVALDRLDFVENESH